MHCSGPFGGFFCPGVYNCLASTFNLLQRVMFCLVQAKSMRSDVIYIHVHEMTAVQEKDKVASKLNLWYLLSNFTKHSITPSACPADLHTQFQF